MLGLSAPSGEWSHMAMACLQLLIQSWAFCGHRWARPSHTGPSCPRNTSGEGGPRLQGQEGQVTKPSRCPEPPVR